jgi:FkbH-like protein
MIKCVVWDIDGTLLDGVFLESGPESPVADLAADPRPAPDQAMTGVLAELAGRGVLHALASRNPPAAAEYVERVTGHRFAATECGWGPKSDAIRRISAELGMAADHIAFVDDDALERAEVSFAMPEVTVLAPEEMTEAVSWPQFSPPVVTDEARRRGELYLTRRRRQEEAAAYGGSRDGFLRHCQTRVVIATAGPGDLPRLHELSVRTHQFNSAGHPVGQETLARLVDRADHLVITVRLSDRYGDDGMVGGCVIATGGGATTWEVRLLMLSCRAMGRGVIDALLAWICRSALLAGAGQVTIPCVINARNVPLRIALTTAGFRADSDPAVTPGRAVSYRRSLDGPVPELPDWASDQAAGAAA